MQVAGKRIVVLGAARSGIAAAILLAQQKARVFVSEINKNVENPELLELFRAKGIDWEFGKHSNAVFKSDYAILSPGIPLKARILQELALRNIPIYPEIEAASWFCEGPIIAVTGSNGKTSTTMLITDMLQHSGMPAVSCANIGYPFSQAVSTAIADVAPHPIYVTELSSFQLDTIHDFHPHVAVILNITADHLDRYDSFLNYALSKCRILMNQNQKDFAVLNRDDEMINKHAKTSAKILPISHDKNPDSAAYFDSEYFRCKIGSKCYQLPRKEIPLVGIHNEYNIAAAVSAVSPFLREASGIFESLKHFKSIPHRIEFAGESRNIRFYNDSKGSNIDAVIMAIRSFQSPIHLILGGRDKNGDFKALAPYLSEKDRLYLIGESAEKIYDHLAEFSPLLCGDLETAVHKAYKAAKPGDVILLSPACASFDQYKDYEERGEHFKSIVRRIIGTDDTA